MSGCARLGDSITGRTSGEHNGHYPPHGPCGISGTITTGSPNIFVNGKPIVTVGSLTNESDCCDSNRQGTVAAGSGKIFANGKAVARIGDAINPHNGTATIASGSSNVIVN